MSRIISKSSRKRKPRLAESPITNELLVPESKPRWAIKGVVAQLSATHLNQLLHFLTKIHGKSEPIHLILERGKKAFTYVCDRPRHILEEWEQISQFDHVYFTLHPSSQSEKMERRRLQRRGRGRKDDTITRIRVVQIDIDPIRSMKKKCSATQSERRNAKRLAKSVYKYLKRQGWPKPVVLSSGNGYQIYYLCDFPPGFKPRIQQLQKHLAGKFSSNVAQVDTDASRLTQFGRLPGMMNCKGIATKSRPYRRTVFCKKFTRWNRKLTEDDFDFLPAVREQQQPSKECPLQISSGPEFRSDLLRRAVNYVRHKEAAESGNHGHNTTFRVSRTLAELGLNDAEAKYVLHHYNKRCKPPWSELELQHKWDGAKNKVSKVVSRERESESFFGFVPDWGMGLHREILQHLNKRNWSTGEIVERFNTTQFRRIHNAIPADFIRQFFLRPPFSRNWRRDLDSRILPYWRELDSFRSPGNFENCVFCSQASSKHSHFNIGERSKRFLRDFWAVEENGKVKLASTQMIKHSPQQIEEDFFEHPSAFYDFKNPLLKEKFNALWKNHVLRLIYWPTLLLGQVAKIPADEIRAIFGLTSELTRQASGTSASRPPMLVTDAEVDVGVKGTPAECPFIDQKKKYVVFGGNGRRAGLGYRPIGRTNKGWLSRLVVPQEGDANRESNSSKLRRLRFLFSNLVPRLHHNFEIIAVAHHPGVNEWRGPDALAQLVMSESGFKWLQNTTIRFFAPADWTLRWRKLLCDRLGYQSIPSSSSEVATSQRKKDPARVDNLVRFLREQQLTQADFATRLSEHFGRTFSKKRVQRHLSGKRDNQEFWDFVWLYLNAVDSHPETRHSRNRPEAPPRTHLPALAATQ